MLGRWRWACGGCGVLRSRFYCNACLPLGPLTAIPNSVPVYRNNRTPARELHCLVDSRCFNPRSLQQLVRTCYGVRVSVTSFGQLARAESQPSQARHFSITDKAVTDRVSVTHDDEGSTSKPEPKLRYTELNENGQMLVTDGEFKKAGLIAKVCRFDLVNRPIV